MKASDRLGTKKTKLEIRSELWAKNMEESVRHRNLSERQTTYSGFSQGGVGDNMIHFDNIYTSYWNGYWNRVIV